MGKSAQEGSQGAPGAYRRGLTRAWLATVHIQELGLAPKHCRDVPPLIGEQDGEMISKLQGELMMEDRCWYINSLPSPLAKHTHACRSQSIN